MTIVYVGDLWTGATSLMRMRALQTCGHDVIGLDSTYAPTGLRGLGVRLAARMGYAADPMNLNTALPEAAHRHRPDLIWIDKGLRIKPTTLRAIRHSWPRIRIVHYSPDDMAGKHNQSIQYLRTLPLYDLHVTTKSFNVPELREMGARQVLFLNNAYCDQIHRPIDIGPNDRAALGGQVGFIGAFEEDRAEALHFLAASGLKVRVWGGWGIGWKRWASRHSHLNLTVELRALWSEEYARAICSFDVNLGFLRKLNRDLQTTRSVEIPACGAFMLAERTSEHLRLFEDGVEAEFYSGREELLTKCRYYVEHSEDRIRIAIAGRKRCVESGYSYSRQVKTVIENLTTQTSRPDLPAHSGHSR
jgi:hypothetical protein